MKNLLSRHAIWRQFYRENRYCRHLNQQELNQRIRDVVLIMVRLNADGKIELPPVASDDIGVIGDLDAYLE